MPIHLLPPEVASQIAAGEVVERPASVVKELIENSLDAEARIISVTIEGAGRRLIEVADDGQGIPPEEFSMAVARHATSKLSDADDLFHIRTLGFRGEALASIGSVSSLTLTSHCRDCQTGARMRVDGGQEGEIQVIGAPTGTVVRVENLFYNVPARLKFLKSDATERSQIDALLTRYAMAYPNVRFTLQQEGKNSLQSSGNGASREVLAALYGVDVARQMIEVLADYDSIKVRGYISPTSLTRSNRREITFFVNGRPVQDASLAAAVLQAYHNLLMVGRFPMVVLFLTVPPDAVDVNVHPAKAEVRFRQREEVFSGVQRAIRRALLASAPVPGLQMDQGAVWGEDRSLGSTDPGWEMAHPGTSPALGSRVSLPWNQPPITDPPGEGIYSAEHQASAPVPEQQPGLPGRGVPLLRLIGQVAATYLIAEGPDGLYLIDQHAAHERVLFERLMAQRTGGIPSQTLLNAASVELAPSAARLLAEQIPILSELGFQVEPFGANSFLVRALPALLAGSDPVSALKVLVEDFEENEAPLQAEVEARIIARVCKRAAVKAGKTLSPQEQQALLHDLESCQSPRTCPHGRPTMIHLSVDLLERQFGRKGAR